MFPSLKEPDWSAMLALDPGFTPPEVTAERATDQAEITSSLERAVWQEVLPTHPWPSTASGLSQVNVESLTSIQLLQEMLRELEVDRVAFGIPEDMTPEELRAVRWLRNVLTYTSRVFERDGPVSGAQALRRFVHQNQLR